ncbi:MAG TPA: hydroxymethylglutaryl-CoA synthase [bacterium]|nr:hydroxymethylglutaryl-CoA synthase [bacterium]
MAGITGYGAAIPYHRVSVEEIHRVWRNISLDKIKDVLKVNERAVLQPNEDTITLAIEASRNAMEHAGVQREVIDALFLGTCTNPYDSKPSMTVLSQALGTGPAVMGGDVQFSGKSGSTAMQICLGLVNSKMARAALAVGADTLNRHTSPGRFYEYTASAGAAAFVIGTQDPLAEIVGTSSYASDLSDFFRVEGDRYIQNIGVGGELYPAWEIGFADHVSHAANALMKELNLKPRDYDYAVFQQPFGFAPFSIGERLGFAREQIEPGVIAPVIGDCGAASALLGLIHVLDTAKPKQRILLATYGFGAGSDALSLEVTPAIEKKRPAIPLADSLYKRKAMVDYATSSRFEYKYIQDSNPLYI